MNGKRVSLVIAGGPQDGHRQVVVDEETTIEEITAKENLQGYQLSLGTGKAFLAAQDKVYNEVQLGDKIYATTRAQQG